MASRRDKEKVSDEVWADDRIRTFLDRAPADATTGPDHFRLLAAYQGMRAGDFRRFLGMFVEAGGNPDAPDEHGRTLADVIARHRHGTDYLDALAAHGARAPVAAPQAATQET